MEREKLFDRWGSKTGVRLCESLPSLYPAPALNSLGMKMVENSERMSRLELNGSLAADALTAPATAAAAADAKPLLPVAAAVQGGKRALGTGAGRCRRHKQALSHSVPDNGWYTQQLASSCPHSCGNRQRLARDRTWPMGWPGAVAANTGCFEDASPGGLAQQAGLPSEGCGGAACCHVGRRDPPPTDLDDVSTAEPAQLVGIVCGHMQRLATGGAQHQEPAVAAAAQQPVRVPGPAAASSADTHTACSHLSASRSARR